MRTTTWQAITETEYDEQLGAQYDYSRVATIISEYPLDTVYADGTIMDLPMLTIQDMRGNDAHQLIPYYLSGIRDMDEMTFVQDRFVRPGQSDSVTFDLLSDQQDYLDPENYRDVAATHDVPLPSYDRFVRRFYTQLPEATEAFFDRQPDLPDPITIRTYSTAQAVSLIREFLWAMRNIRSRLALCPQTPISWNTSSAITIRDIVSIMRRLPRCCCAIMDTPHAM